MDTTMIAKQRMIVMRLSGDIDHHSAGEIRRRLESEIRGSGAVNIAFDMRDVTFMDSSGIGVMIGRYKTVSALGGHMIVYNASDRIKRLLEMSGIDRLAVVCDTLREGIDRINAAYVRGGKGKER